MRRTRPRWPDMIMDWAERHALSVAPRQSATSAGTECAAVCRRGAASLADRVHHVRRRLCTDADASSFLHTVRFAISP